MSLLKELGANFVRGAHYSQDLIQTIHPHI